MKWAINACVSQFRFLQVKCFAQALSAHILLKHRKIPTVLFLGVKKERNTMEAHAWLCCNDQMITGEKEAEKFQKIAAFH